MSLVSAPKQTNMAKVLQALRVQARIFAVSKRIAGKINEKAAAQFPQSYSTPSKQLCSTEIPEFDGLHGLKSYQDLYEFSLNDPDTFWGTLARSRLSWIKDFDKVQACDMRAGDISYFLNGKINVSGRFSNA